MKKLFLAFSSFVLAGFLAACGSKNDEQVNVELKKQVLMYAQKVKFTQSGENNLSENGVFVLSYLNFALENEEKHDIFALAVSPKETNTSTLRAFMDDKEAQISPLDEQLKKFVVDSDYAAFYKLTFPFKDDAFISVRLCLAAECFELGFQKYSKSLYFRSADVDTLYN